MKDMELEVIRTVLSSVEWNRRRAAAVLGIGERTPYRKVGRYRLDEEMEWGSRLLARGCRIPHRLAGSRGGVP